MERYHIYKLGLAVFFCLIYLARVAVIDGLRINDLIENATDNRERRDAVVDSASYKSDSDGTPGVDYPNLAFVPKTRFSCRDMETGYYADLETDCQVFHICDESRKISFLCPNGTIFQQSELICDWWFKVNCTTSPLLYEESAEILVRENAKRKQSRRVYNKGNKQNIFSSGENYYEDSSQRTTPAHFITPSYRNQYYDRKFATTTDNSIPVRRGDRRLDYDTNQENKQVITNRGNNNYISKSNIIDNNFHKRLQGTTTNDANTHSRLLTNRTSEHNTDINQIRHNKNNLHLNNKTEKFVIRPNQSKINFNTNGHKETSYYDSYENQREGETQEVQETASFVKNYRNNIDNIHQKSTTFYPNHRQTYSEIKDPRYYVDKPYNKFPVKPFYGFTTTPQVLSTIPVSAQHEKFTTERYFNFQQYTIPTFSSQTMQPTTTKYFQKYEDEHFRQNHNVNNRPTMSTFNIPTNSNRDSKKITSNYDSFSNLFSVSTTTEQNSAFSSSPTPNYILHKKANNHNNNNGVNESSDKRLFKSYSATTAQYKQPSTDSPVISFNIIPLTARPPYEVRRRKEKMFVDSPKTQIALINNTTSKSALPLQIPTNNEEYEENIFSMNFKNSKSNYLNLPKNHKLSDNSFTTVKDRSTSILSQIENTRKNITFGNTGPYVYEKPDVLYSTTEPITNTSLANSNNTSSFDNIRFVINNQTFKITENNNGIQNISTDIVFNDNTDIVTESQPTKTIKININNGIYSTSITPLEQEDDVVNPLSISNNPNILYTSPSTILQPQPFSFSQVNRNPTTISSIISANPSGVPHLQIYTVSTSSPFSTADNNPVPTLPTPYLTTPDYEKTSQLVNENVNNMINSLMQVVKKYNNNINNADNTPRPGLVVPPSVGPDTLRTLAIYFASALDNMTASSNFSSQEIDEFEEGSPTSHINNEKLIKAFLTQMTRQNYESLFNTPIEDLGTTEATTVLTTEFSDTENDLIKEDSKNLVDDLTVRQLARVFTEALSFYLDDPDTFKKVLHEVRPKEPVSADGNSDLNDADDDEVLNYSDSDLKFDHLHLSTRPAAQPATPTWGYILALNDSYQNSNRDSENTNSLSSEQENLQSADSQSFISQFNKIKQKEKQKLTTQNLSKNIEYTENPLKIETDIDNEKTLPNDHWTTSLDVAKLWQNTLFVNPEALNNNFNTTNTEIDSFELDTASTKYFNGETSSEEVSIENGLYSNIDETDLEYQLKKLAKHELNSTEVHNILSSFMNSNKSKKLDRLLNELNVSKKEFLQKMEEVETDPANRQLILLLIRKCNTDDGSIQSINKNNSDISKTNNIELTNSNKDAFNYYSDAELNEDAAEGINTQNYNNEGFTESNLYQKIVDPSLKDDSEDTRALELLNSLYVIASKYGK